MKFKFLRNNRGQVAIFIALMFQVLFLFFAMIVNVGLLVHHKINLQNSVDIAAYYGASKQAEVLNAISHVNYQIRQSWKLLVWRQKVLGTAGIDRSTPMFPYGKLLSGQSPDEVLAGITGGNVGTKVFQLPTFCISYAPHEINGSSNTTENSCRYMHNATVVDLPRANILSLPSFISFGFAVSAAITQAAQSAFDRCADTGALNFIMGGKFISAHYLDSIERAFLMNYLATGLSLEENNFFELSGDEVKIGLEKTLKKNLTSANSSTVEFEIFNSLGASSCKNSNTAGKNTPQWLVPIEIYPIWRYLDCKNNNNTAAGLIETESRQLVNSMLPTQLSGAKPDLIQGVQNIAKNLPMRTTLVGFEKDPWCVPYVGLRAKAKPKIPFMPLSEVEITAEAYAKPFGGRIGPWYVKDWPQAVTSNARLNYKTDAIQANDQIDPIGGVRVSSTSGITGIDDPAWAPNIARFFGDRLGFSSERVLAYFHRALVGNSYTALPQTPNYPFPVLPPAQDLNISLRYYNHISSDYIGPDNPDRDQLTWDTIGKMAPRLRLLEIAAIAPTIYDLANYSIDPDFYNNYFLPIEKHIAKRNGWDSAHRLLGDYGWRWTDEKAKKMNIFDQIKIQRDVGVAGALESDSTMPYVVKKAGHLLNSWSVDNLLDYRANSVKFGKCFSPDDSNFETPMNPPTPGNCVDGGRVGNSVKLVSKEWLKATDLELGGNGQTGSIRNPPPW